MNYLILGSGKMAEGIIFDLLKFSKNDKVYVCDINEANLEKIETNFKSGKIHTIIFDANDTISFERLLDGIDAVISTLPIIYNFELSRITVTNGIHWIDLGSDLLTIKKQISLSGIAEANNVCIIPDTGLAPGMVSIISAYLLKGLQGAKSLRMMVGGLPQKKSNPLNYQIVFSVNGLINEYVEKCIVLENSQVKEKPALEDLEAIKFPSPFTDMEAFNTSGGSSTIPYTMKDVLQNVSYKTIRYKGHRDLVKAMIDMGFASNKINSINGFTRTNRELFEILLESSLMPTLKDVVLVRIIVESENKAIQAELVKYYDKTSDLSAMTACTGFSSSIIAQMVLSGQIKKRGFIYQEIDIDPNLFLNEIEKRNINFKFSI